jgi:hypothetical protein
MEELSPPAGGTPFGFWGMHGRLPRREGVPIVELRYRTEPPHGDFLYSLELDGEVVCDEGGIRVFWGRKVVSSPCGGYLAIMELSEPRLNFSVFNLRERTEYRRVGDFDLISLVFPILTVRPRTAARSDASRGPEEEKRLDLKKSVRWKPISTRRSFDDGPLPWPPRPWQRAR